MQVCMGFYEFALHSGLYVKGSFFLNVFKKASLGKCEE